MKYIQFSLIFQFHCHGLNKSNQIIMENCHSNSYKFKNMAAWKLKISYYLGQAH